jgi:hypothetical protein
LTLSNAPEASAACSPSPKFAASNENPASASFAPTPDLAPSGALPATADLGATLEFDESSAFTGSLGHGESALVQSSIPNGTVFFRGSSEAAASWGLGETAGLGMSRSIVGSAGFAPSEPLAEVRLSTGTTFTTRALSFGIGIGAAAVLCLVALAVYLSPRRKISASTPMEMVESELIPSESSGLWDNGDEIAIVTQLNAMTLDDAAAAHSWHLE